jgi:riboflavin transporter FmnP
VTLDPGETMTDLRSAQTPTATGRVLFHVLGALGNVLILVALHVWPGWDVVPFLTGETPRVLGLLDAALVAGIVVHLVQLAGGPGWLTPAGLVVTSAFGMAVSAWAFQVFPFDLTGGWETVVRGLLVVSVVGSAIAAVAALVSMVRIRAAESRR